MKTRVILFVIDGLRADALEQAETPTLHALMQRGAYTLAAQTVMPSITLPTHTSMMHGVPPEVHGITSNTWQALPVDARGVPLPGIFDLLHQNHLRTAAFTTWEELRDLWRPGAVDEAAFVNIYGPRGSQSDTLIAQLAADHIAREQPDFTFVYLGLTDEIGHHFGWLSAEYCAAVQVADAAIAHVLDVLAEKGLLADTTCLVTADHGGHRHDHGDNIPEDMTIPWIMAGPGIRSGVLLAEPVRIYDTAPTIAHLLGVPLPTAWQGRVIAEALSEA